MTCQRRSRGFTLVELMIVVAVIAILLSLVIVGIRRVQVAAARTESVNALRQMVAGYLGYAGDNNGRLMPGYLDFDDTTPESLYSLNAKLPSGEWMVESGNQEKFTDRHLNLNSYVWRLTPYLANNWQTVMTDYRDRAIESFFAGQVDDDTFGPGDLAPPGSDTPPTVASAPSFGLNSLFLGGDNRHGGFLKSGDGCWQLNPWDPEDPDFVLAETRSSRVRNPNVIVFAAAGRVSTAWAKQGDPVYDTNHFGRPIGYPEIRPPFLEKVANTWITRQWEVGESSEIIPNEQYVGTPTYNKGAGLPVARHGGRHVPVGRFDGSAEPADVLTLLTDMRNWDPRETGIQPHPVDWPP